MLDLLRFAKDSPNYSFNKKQLALVAKKLPKAFNNPLWTHAWKRLVALGIFKNTTNEKGKIFKQSFCLAIAAHDLIDEKLKNISDSGMDVRGTRTEPEEKPTFLETAVKRSLELDKENEDAKLNVKVEIYNAQRQTVINEIAVIGIQIKKLEKKAEALYEILAEITA